MVKVLLYMLWILLVGFAIMVLRDVMTHRDDLGAGNVLIAGAISAFTNFLDTLGIGSFAPQTALLKATNQVPDDTMLPGVLNVGNTVPVIAEALIFIQTVEVDPLTLFSMIISAMAGSWIGSGIVSRLPERKVQVGVGCALILTSLIMTAQQLGWIELLGAGNTAIGLTGGKLIFAIICNFIFGALMTLGVGLYAPCMALCYVLGLTPLAAFPIMMGSCAALMPVASANFVRTGHYMRKISVAIAIVGLVGVYIGTQIITSLDLTVLTWLVIVVIIYTGIGYLRKGMQPEEAVA